MKKQIKAKPRPTKKARRRPGPKPKLKTVGLTEAICKLIELGVPVKYACAEVGIDPATFHRWMDHGRPKDDEAALNVEPVAQPDHDKSGCEMCAFYEAVTRARATKIRTSLELIRKAAAIPNRNTGQLDWKAAAFILETTERDHFAKTSKVQNEISGKDGKPVDVTVGGTWLDIVRSARTAKK